MKIGLTIITYKVKLAKQDIIQEDGTKVNTLAPLINDIDKYKDTLKNDNFEIDSETENVQLKIQELSQKAKKFNSMQLKLANAGNWETAKWQIVTTVNK